MMHGRVRRWGKAAHNDESQSTQGTYSVYVHSLVAWVDYDILNHVHGADRNEGLENRW